MTSPAEIQSLVKKVNGELRPLTAKFQSHIPLADITSILVNNGLDPKAVQNGLQHNDEGRMHVSVGNDVFLTLTWYKFESSGRYEIVAYASSQHDDVEAPAKPMDPSEKRKAMSTANKELDTVGKTYWKGLGQACGVVSDALEAVGFSAHEFNHEALTGTAGRKDGHLHAAVGNGVYLSFQFHRMDSGNYEIVAYLS